MYKRQEQSDIFKTQIQLSSKEIKNDNKPETEEIPNDKTKEQVVVLPEFKTNRNKENIKQRKRKLRKTQEEMEMMNHGLMDVNNVPITNHEEIRNSRDYGRRLKVISEIMYQQTVVYQWEGTRGKWNTTGMEIYGRVSMVSWIIDGPEMYWCIKHYDRGSRISLSLIHI